MNITNHSFYNKTGAGGGLRRPSSILDQNYKLVFVYPMLLSNDLKKYELTLRQFHTITMLKEIFISNSLNLVSLTSHIQSPFNSNNNINVGELVGNALMGMRSGNSQIQLPNIDYGLKRELEQKIEQKINRIQQYLQSDPIIKNLEPQIDFMTLENLVDVPIIVGSKPFSIDVFSMLLLLTGSTALSLPLNKIGNLERVNRELSGIRPDQISLLLNKLIQKDPRSFLEKFLYDKPRLRYISGKISEKINNTKSNIKSKYINRLQRFVPLQNRKQSTSPTNQQNQTTTDTQVYVSPPDAFQILKFNKSDMNQAVVFFKFMLDSDAFKRQYGIDTHADQMSGIIDTINPDIQRISSLMFQQLQNLMATASSPILRSIHLLLAPYPEAENSSFVRIKSNYIDSQLSAKFLDIIQDKLIGPLQIQLKSAKINESDQQIKEMKKLCQNVSNIEEKISQQFSRLMDTSDSRFAGIGDYKYEIKHVTNFLSEFQNIASAASSHTKNFQFAYSRIVRNPATFNIISDIVYDIIDDFFNHYVTSYDQNRVSFIAYMGFYDQATVIRKLIPEMKNTLYELFYFFIFYQLQVALCQLVDVIELKIESGTHDVLEWPNFTLVLPIQIINYLHTVIMAKNWQNLVDSPMFNSSQNPAVNDNYIKGIVNFISKRLQIPNIIIVDDKKQDVYYKFMHMSSVIKAKISSIETFVRQHQNN